MAARPRWRCARRSRPRPSPAPPPTMPPSAPGSPRPSATERRRGASSPGHWSMRSATARTRINGRPSIAPASTRFGVATARQVQGKELSYNNLNDADAAYELVAEFDSERDRGRRHHQARQSLRRRHRRVAEARLMPRLSACDPESAFGGVIALNRSLDADAARRSSRSSPRSSSRRTRATRRRRSSPRRRTCVCCLPADCPTRGPPVSPSARSPAASSCSRATRAWRTKT